MSFGDLVRWLRPGGTYPVGFVEFALTDGHRAATYAPEPTAHRELAVMAWYPAASGNGFPRRCYLDRHDVEEGAHSFLNLLQAPLQEQVRLASLETAAFINAPVARGRFPLLVFCHGGGMYRQQCSIVMEHLASVGYIVVSVAHPFESGNHSLPDGRRLNLAPGMLAEARGLVGIPEHLEIYFGSDLAERRRAISHTIHWMRDKWLGRLPHVWADDLLFVVDAIERSAVPAHVGAVAAAADTHSLGYFGMSIGGHVAALCCLKDPRARAGVNLDGGVFTAEPVGRELGVPFLAFTEDLSVGAAMFGRTVPPPSPDSATLLDFAYQRVDGIEPVCPVHRLTLRGAAHHDFTDVPLLLDPAKVPMVASKLSAERSLRVQARVVGDFFDRYVRGMENDFPARVAAEFDDLLVVHRRKGANNQ